MPPRKMGDGGIDMWFNAKRAKGAKSAKIGRD